MSTVIGIIAVLVTVWLSIGSLALADWLKHRRRAASPPVGGTIRLAFEPCQRHLSDWWSAPRLATLWAAAWTGIVAMVVFLIVWPVVLTWLLPSHPSQRHGGAAGT